MKTYNVTFMYYTYVNISVDAETEEQAKFAAERKLWEMHESDIAQSLFQNRTLEGTETTEE